ncbi:LysR family transcriptional regulator [Pseudorhodoferax sp. Leaf267]|uniref:LysR family transcriptional regulator n=1 Tax=Pseudorhodoferax sp. Leaf267 TaxID=1736316 RepID=UPI0006F328E3|nr:LysR family transcriptional regulator [Pseudorhodoferax sp. Leaf267]KQP13679.1 hypothetical protein ASF43_17430 [Pseudorhodoferax sp. Leaf267]
MDQLKSMRAFVKVLDEGSFAGAARAMDTATSVVTRAIADLERELGSRLLNRTTRTLSLTEVGAAYLERVRSILEDLDDANAQAVAATGEIRGRLRIAAPEAMLTGSLGKLLPGFAARHPQVEMQLIVSQGTADVPDDSADVTVLLHGPLPLDGNFVARLLARSEVLLCATPEYLQRRGQPKKPDDLKDHVVLVPEGAITHKDWMFHLDDAKSAQSVALKPQRAALSSASAAVLHAAGRNSFGIFGSLSLDVVQDLRDGLLVRVLPRWRIGTYGVYAAMPSRRHLPLRTRAFLDYLVEQYGGKEADPWLAGKVR